MSRDQIRNDLLDLLKEETWEEMEDVKDSSKIREDLQLDSVDMISLVLRIENKYRIKFGNDDLAGIDTVGNLLDFIETRIANISLSDAA